jgi:hypothetical protein
MRVIKEAGGGGEVKDKDNGLSRIFVFGHKNDLNSNDHTVYQATELVNI